MESVFQQLADEDILLLYLLDQHYLNPLDPKQRVRLQEAGLLGDAGNRAVLVKLMQAMNELPPAAYFPTPIAREMQQGAAFSLILARKYSYAHIQVDAWQSWSMRGVRLDKRLKKFLEAYLAYEVELQRYFVEYRVDQRMDKCYLDCETTPMLVRNIEIRSKDQLSGLLNNGKYDQLDPWSFRMDEQENLYCRSTCHGEVMLADNPRFRILERIMEDGNSFRLNNSVYPLSFHVQGAHKGAPLQLKDG